MGQIDWLVCSHWYSIGEFTEAQVSFMTGRTTADCYTPGLAVDLAVPCKRGHSQG